MTPTEAMKILDPADPFLPKNHHDDLMARSMGAGALSKMVPMPVSSSLCPICKSRVEETDSYCKNCGQRLEWG